MGGRDGAWHRTSVMLSYADSTLILFQGYIRTQCPTLNNKKCDS